MEAQGGFKMTTLHPTMPKRKSVNWGSDGKPKSPRAVPVVKTADSFKIGPHGEDHYPVSVATDEPMI